MMYFDDMSDKFGFNDGEAIPHGVEFYREVYIHAINELANKYGSSFRASPYNRSGLHNWCLIVFSRDNEGELKLFPRSDVDKEMKKAIYVANCMFLDDLVKVKVSLAKNALQLITKDVHSKATEVDEKEFEESYA